MQVLQGEDDFSDVDSDFCFGELFPLVEMSKQLASVHVICNMTGKSADAFLASFAGSRQ